MITYPTTLKLSDPDSVGVIPASDLSYIKTRNRLSIFNSVLKQFRDSGITKSELAARLGKDAGQLSRLLGAPGNWTLDTVAELLWAMSGTRVRGLDLDKPLLKAKRNSTAPAWAVGNPEITRSYGPAGVATVAPREFGTKTSNTASALTI